VDDAAEKSERPKEIAAHLMAMSEQGTSRLGYVVSWKQNHGVLRQRINADTINKAGKHRPEVAKQSD
jgi:hypothetical protein